MLAKRARISSPGRREIALDSSMVFHIHAQHCSDGAQVASTVMHEARDASSPSRRGSFRALEVPMVSAERQEWQERSLSDSDPRHWIQQALRIDVQPLSDELLELLMHRWVNIQILTPSRRGSPCYSTGLQVKKQTPTRV